MDSREVESPDFLCLTVDGQNFEVQYDEEQPGTYHYTWVNRPASGYGVTVRFSDHARTAYDTHRRQIQEHLIDCGFDTESGAGTSA